MPITDLFQEEARQITVYERQDQGLRSQSDGALMESLGIGLFNQQMEPFRMVAQSGPGNWNDPIAHAGGEFIYSLKGAFEYKVAERVFKLEHGDSPLFDATQMHAYRNPYDTQAVALMVFLAYQDPQIVRKLHI